MNSREFPSLDDPSTFCLLFSPARNTQADDPSDPWPQWCQSFEPMLAVFEKHLLCLEAQEPEGESEGGGTHPFAQEAKHILCNIIPNQEHLPLPKQTIEAALTSRKDHKLLQFSQKLIRYHVFTITDLFHIMRDKDEETSTTFFTDAKTILGLLQFNRLKKSDREVAALFVHSWNDKLIHEDSYYCDSLVQVLVFFNRKGALEPEDLPIISQIQDQLCGFGGQYTDIAGKLTICLETLSRENQEET